MKPPFTVSPEAERYIHQRTKRPPDGTEPALHGASRLEVHDREGRLVARCDRPHYFIGFGPAETHAEPFTYYDLCGRRFAIHRATVASLRGKQLAIGRTDPIAGVDSTNEILLALPSEQSTKET